MGTNDEGKESTYKPLAIQTIVQSNMIIL